MKKRIAGTVAAFVTIFLAGLLVGCTSYEVTREEYLAATNQTMFIGINYRASGSVYGEKHSETGELLQIGEQSFIVIYDGQKQYYQRDLLVRDSVKSDNGYEAHEEEYYDVVDGRRCNVTSGAHIFVAQDSADDYLFHEILLPLMEDGLSIDFDKLTYNENEKYYSYGDSEKKSNYILQFTDGKLIHYERKTTGIEGQKESFMEIKIDIEYGNQSITFPNAE